jgi:shikimate dehydrogenase
MAKAISRSGLRFGLLGWPLDHSLSPVIHKAALAACGLEGDYALLPAPPLPAGAQILDSHLQKLRWGELHGLNVTIPHKQTVIPGLDGLTDIARAAGAVNLIYLENGLLIGDNSDAPAFLADLQRLLGSEGRPGTALVLGAGGAARAAVYALQNADWRVYIASRSVKTARQLITDLAPQGGKRLLPLTSLELEATALRELPAFDLLINATPLGMHPKIHEMPWPTEVPFPQHAAIYDMVYNPAETTLVKAARCAGLAAANGLGMLVEQAALSFERWTGLSAPREIMWETAVASLYKAGKSGTE